MQKLLLKLLNTTGLAEAGRVRSTKGGIREPKSHEIVIFVCLLRGATQWCILLIFLEVHYDIVYNWDMWQHIIIWYDFEDKHKNLMRLRLPSAQITDDFLGLLPK